MSATTWIALLRGINVGGRKRVAMADLRALLESLGYGNIRTLLQSGNAVFTASRGGAAKFERQIAAQIQADLGLEVSVLVRAAAEFAAVVDANPFVAGGADRKQLHAAFLSGPPPPERLASLDRQDYLPDEFEFGSNVIYLRVPNGIGGSRLPDWERLLRVTVTIRNWNTVTRLRDLAAG